MVSAYANSRALVVILSVLLLSWGTFANFDLAYAVSFPITVDNIASYNGVCSSCSFNHIVGSLGSDKIIIVGISPKASATISGVTYNGIPLTEIRTDQDAGVTRSSLWYLLNPPVGSNAVKVTLSVSEEVTIGVISLNNVDQTDPIGNNSGATGKSTTPTVNLVTTVNDSLIVDIVGTLDGPLNAGGGQIEQWDVNNGSTRGAGSIEVTTIPGSYTMSWTNTVGSKEWSISAVEIKPVANNIPVVTISNPSDNSSYVDGTFITFTATANDAEDGVLTGSISWISDLDSAFGSGGSVTSVLSIGIHTITASAIDSFGNLALETRTISVTGLIPACNGKTVDEWEALGYSKFIGSSADDSITGTSGNDIIVSLEGNDDINSLGGDDVICSSDGDDQVFGGGGNDFIDAGEGKNHVHGDSGNDVIITGVDADDIDGNQGADQINSGSGDDQIYGGDGADTIDAGDGANYIEGNQDVDIISAGSGADKIYGGDGADTIDAGDGDNYIEGNQDVDIISAGSGADKIYGGDGDDCINSGGGTDTIDAGSGTNSVNVGTCKNDIPNVEIPFPSEGSVFTEGTTIAFSGSAVDPEDGIISNLLSWTSNIDGVIGSGNSFSLSTLAVGIHSITASVIDSTGNTASHTHAITITGISMPALNILSPFDSDNYVEGTSVSFSGTGTDLEDGIISGSIIWTSDLDGIIGNGESFSISTLSVGTHTIKASITDSNSHTNSISLTITIGPKVIEELTTLICHFPPGNPGNWHELMIGPSALQAHKEHGDKVGPCVNNDDLEKRLDIIKIKEQREETSKKNELKEKRNELKEIQNDIKQLKKNIKNDEDLKDTLEELITDIKETLQTLKSDFDYDKEYKEELKTEFKEIKQKIYDDLTVPEKNAIHTVDSKISILSHSDDPKSDAKKLGLDYKNGMTTVAIQLTDDNNKVLHQLSSIGTIDAKNNNNVQITLNLNDLPKLSSIQGIENIRPPFPAVQFEESLSEGVYFMNADLAQYAGITGKGIKVAVLDLSFTNNPKISDNIVEVKSFRQGVSVLPDHWDGDEALHGTAVAEIIADVAPDVELFLYSMESDIEFATAVDEAISKNIDIIAMSAGWPNFPTDGTSHITKKIEEAVENGIVFVVPAGNFGNKHWEGNFVDSNLNNWHDFSNTDEGLSITVTEARIAEEKPIIAHMMWDVGLEDVADFELVLVDPLGQIVDFSANKQEKSSDNPFEYIYHHPDTEGIYSLGVLYSGDMVSPSNRPHATLEIFTVNDELEYPITQSSVSVPADANGAIVVGAVNHLDGILEPYSSQGPTNNGKLAPHVVGPDGVTTLALDGKPFYGTSATTPYVAGLAALILENNPDMSPEQLLTKIQQNTEPSLFSLQNEYDYATGYGTASAVFLIDDSEVMQ